MAKVVIIGGGSLGFAGGLTRDILSYPATSDAEFVYVDINPTRLELGVQYAQRIIDEGKNLTIRFTDEINGSFECGLITISFSELLGVSNHTPLTVVTYNNHYLFVVSDSSIYLASIKEK